MIGKILAHLLGNADERSEADPNDAADETCEDLVEFEDGGWVIVRILENLPLELPEQDPLENMLIEHPSMSVFQRKSRLTEEELVDTDEEEEDSPSPVPIKHHVSWRLAAWGFTLPCHDNHLALHRARALTQRKRLTKSALHRQNLAKTHFSAAERRYGYFKQPCQRVFNY